MSIFFKTVSGGLMFHYRESELAKLNKRYQSRQFECIVIYGRRRVGKTALINEFCKDKKTIFFAALNAAILGFTIISP